MERSVRGRRLARQLLRLALRPPSGWILRPARGAFSQGYFVRGRRCSRAALFKRQRNHGAGAGRLGGTHARGRVACLCACGAGMPGARAGHLYGARAGWGKACHGCLCARQCPGPRACDAGAHAIRQNSCSVELFQLRAPRLCARRSGRARPQRKRGRFSALLP